MANCRPYLDEQIEIIRPRVILALGAPAAKSFLGPQFSITRQRGRWYAGPGDIPLMASFHPAYILRQTGGEVMRSNASCGTTSRPCGRGSTKPPIRRRPSCSRTCSMSDTKSLASDRWLDERTRRAGFDGTDAFLRAHDLRPYRLGQLYRAATKELVDDVGQITVLPVQTRERVAVRGVRARSGSSR